MAVSKSTRSAKDGTNPFFLGLFRASRISGERMGAWRNAVRHAGSGDSSLRFPVYEHLYTLNLHAQKMVEVLEVLGGRFSICSETVLYHQSLIQNVRASVSQGLLESMAGVEITESWLFHSQLRSEERKLRDPDDIYLEIRKREAERARRGLAPRLRFLDEPKTEKEAGTKKAVTRPRG